MTGRFSARLLRRLDQFIALLLVSAQLAIWYRLVRREAAAAGGAPAATTTHLNQAAIVAGFALFLTLSVVLRPVAWARLRCAHSRPSRRLVPGLRAGVRSFTCRATQGGLHWLHTHHACDGAIFSLRQGGMEDLIRCELQRACRWVAPSAEAPLVGCRMAPRCSCCTRMQRQGGAAACWTGCGSLLVSECGSSTQRALTARAALPSQLMPSSTLARYVLCRQPAACDCSTWIAA